MRYVQIFIILLLAITIEGCGLNFGLGSSTPSPEEARIIEEKRRDAEERARLKAEHEQRIRENENLLLALRAKGLDVRDSPRGVVINLPDLLFAFGKADLTEEAQYTITEIARVVSEVPDRQIAVEGHCDSVGDLNYNYHLSENRARNVSFELESNSVAKERLVVRGMGEVDSIATNRTDEGRRLNRRVEVIIEN